MKKIIVLLLTYISLIYAQTDPLSGNYTLGQAAEVVLTWNVNRYQDTVVNHKVFNYLSNSGQYLIDSTNRGTYDNDYSIDGTREYQTISGDFDGDDLDEIVLQSLEGVRRDLESILNEDQLEPFFGDISAGWLLLSE